METEISLTKASCEEQSNSQASSRRRLQKIGKREPLEIRYEAEEIKQTIEKIEEEEDICEIESSKPSNKAAELDNLVNWQNQRSQRSRRAFARLESNLIDQENESEEEAVIEEEEQQEDIVPKRSLAEIPDLIRINGLLCLLSM